MWAVSKLEGGGVVGWCPVSNEKPDDNQCWPKHVVFIFF